ncbi:DUF2608 domain-containing protein [Luteimonas sp. Y-2-2-4F]|nr:DUF2608 domain-containing protein [Luteimonas sp. Y-2-2-4F]MCD9030474.1 DUF2608 domain-containing protein [Luteimonas sp. Y-2-2-4F]
MPRFHAAGRLASLAAPLVLAAGLATAAAPQPAPLQPRQVERIANLDEATARAQALAARHGAGRVLVVYDIDSTLLRATRRWPDLDPLEARSRDGYRQVERTLMYLTAQAPTEADAAAEVAALQAAGIAVYALTARGTDMRDMTERELRANGIAFPDAPECGPPLCVRRGVLPAQAVMAAARQVLGEAELDRLGFGRGRDVSVSDGVVMASGLHKGVVLRLLLASLGRDYDAVVMVDDLARNADDVRAAAERMPQEVAVLHYRPPSPPVLPGDDAEAERQWRAMRDAICGGLAPRWCAEAAEADEAPVPAPR